MSNYKMREKRNGYVCCRANRKCAWPSHDESWVSSLSKALYTAHLSSYLCFRSFDQYFLRPRTSSKVAAILMKISVINDIKQFENLKKDWSAEYSSCRKT